MLCSLVFVDSCSLTMICGRIFHSRITSCIIQCIVFLSSCLQISVSLVSRTKATHSHENVMSPSSVVNDTRLHTHLSNAASVFARRGLSIPLHKLHKRRELSISSHSQICDKPFVSLSRRHPQDDISEYLSSRINNCCCHHRAKTSVRNSVLTRWLSSVILRDLSPCPISQPCFRCITEKVRRATVVVGRVIPCNRCRTLHVTVASGFFVGPTGVLVTNFHVVEKKINKPPAKNSHKRIEKQYRHDGKSETDNEDGKSYLNVRRKKGTEDERRRENEDEDTDEDQDDSKEEETDGSTEEEHRKVDGMTNRDMIEHLDQGTEHVRKNVLKNDSTGSTSIGNQTDDKQVAHSPTVCRTITIQDCKQGSCNCNYNVDEQNVPTESDEESIIVMDSEGRVWPVASILSSNSHTDLSLLQVNLNHTIPVPPSSALVTDIQAHPTSTTIEVPFLSLQDSLPSPGTPVGVWSHPEGHLYMLTLGVVSRCFHRHGGARPGSEVVGISVSADIAKGSSGAPVFDLERGGIVGVADSTRTIYYGRTKKGGVPVNSQMVIKTAVPAGYVCDLLGRKRR
eukprot:GHVQ01024154.1.p1 GENE.GHVQ01024154.1~~GHVQ01024154.1.p1  ORF type:complete len:567 (-),score=68.16 GHVQ01024154.1:964-2664(-)